MDYQLILENIYEEIKPFENEGKQADYIPALARVNPDQRGDVVGLFALIFKRLNLFIDIL